ncbi:hypothetical protein MMC31_003510 [Peltigera leucophlebia]|nr:hypothetical protein [Peltigera leucophlebia]
MSAEANFDNRGGRDSGTPSYPLPAAILDILARQDARMDELLEQERARCRQELTETLKAACKAQEGRIYKEMRRKVIGEELPRIRFLLKQQLTPLVMEELRAGNAGAAPAMLLPSDKQGHPRGLRRSSSEARLDEQENYNELIPTHDSKRVRTGLSMRRSPNISLQSYPEDYPSPSRRRHIIKSQSIRQLSPLSRAAQSYLQAERAIPSIEKDITPLTEEQLKDAGYYLRSSDDGRGEGFMPSNSDNLPSENPGLDRPLTPFVRQNSVGSDEDSLPNKFTTPSANSSAQFPPLRQPQEAENTVGLVGRIPHGWYASRTDILQKTRETFPHKLWGLSSEFRPLLVFYDQRHILIECEGLHFFWHEPTNSLEQIDSPKDLQEILKQMDHGRLLPRETCIPAEYSAPLRLMELIRAENLLYWSTLEIIHHRRSSVDRAVRQGLIRLGSESSIRESNADDFDERYEENGDNPDTLFGRSSDRAQCALDDRHSREPGYDASSEDNNTHEASFDHPAAILTPSSSSPSPLEEGTTLNNPIDLVSSPSSIQGTPTYVSFTRPSSVRRSSHPDTGEEIDDHDVVDRAMSCEDIVDWRAIERQMSRDEEQYP